MRNDRLFDLAATEMLLYEGREAGVSNEAMWRCRANAARSLWRLRGQLGELAGRGDEAVVEEDVRRLWESNAKDDLGIPLRNCYREDWRRYNINLMSAADMATILPALGTTGDGALAVASQLHRERDVRGGFSTLAEAAEAMVSAVQMAGGHPGQGETTVQALLPLITVGDGLNLQQRGRCAALPDRKTEVEHAVSLNGDRLRCGAAFQDLLKWGLSDVRVLPFGYQPLAPQPK